MTLTKYQQRMAAERQARIASFEALAHELDDEFWTRIFQRQKDFDEYMSIAEVFDHVCDGVQVFRQKGLLQRDLDVEMLSAWIRNWSSLWREAEDCSDFYGN